MIEENNARIAELIIRNAHRLAQHRRREAAAAYLLGSDRPEAAGVMASLTRSDSGGPHKLARERRFWWSEEWIDAPPLRRCLAHVEATDRLDALALLVPRPHEVSTLFTALIEIAVRKRETGAPLFGLHLLAALWTLKFADPAAARQLLDRITPSLWIERFESMALARQHGFESRSFTTAGLRPIRPDWFRLVQYTHPTIARDPIGGAFMSAALGTDPNNMFELEWPTRLPGEWVIYGDIDNLKSIGDSRGHLAADLAIRGVIQTLQERVGDRVIRFGGEEFLVLYEGDDGPALAEELRARVEAARYEPVGHVKEPVNVTISFGVARCGETAKCMHAVEDAVNDAKLNGRNRVVVAGD